MNSKSLVLATIATFSLSCQNPWESSDLVFWSDSLDGSDATNPFNACYASGEHVDVSIVTVTRTADIYRPECPDPRWTFVGHVYEVLLEADVKGNLPLSFVMMVPNNVTHDVGSVGDKYLMSSRVVDGQRIGLANVRVALASDIENKNAAAKVDLPTSFAELTEQVEQSKNEDCPRPVYHSQSDLEFEKWATDKSWCDDDGGFTIEAQNPGF